MDSFLKMDIFFIVTTCAVVILTTLLAVALWRILRILKNAEYIAQQASLEADALRLDLAQLRGSIRTEGFALSHLVRFIRSIIPRSKRATKSKESEPT